MTKTGSGRAHAAPGGGNTERPGMQKSESSDGHAAARGSLQERIGKFEVAVGRAVSGRDWLIADGRPPIGLPDLVDCRDRDADGDGDDGPPEPGVSTVDLCAIWNHATGENLHAVEFELAILNPEIARGTVGSLPWLRFRVANRGGRLWFIADTAIEWSDDGRPHLRSSDEIRDDAFRLRAFATVAYGASRRRGGGWLPWPWSDRRWSDHPIGERERCWSSYREFVMRLHAMPPTGDVERDHATAMALAEVEISRTTPNAAALRHAWAGEIMPTTLHRQLVGTRLAALRVGSRDDYPDGKRPPIILVGMHDRLVTATGGNVEADVIEMFRRPSAMGPNPHSIHVLPASAGWRPDRPNAHVVVIGEVPIGGTIGNAIGDGTAQLQLAADELTADEVEARRSSDLERAELEAAVFEARRRDRVRRGLPADPEPTPARSRADLARRAAEIDKRQPLPPAASAPAKPTSAAPTPVRRAGRRRPTSRPAARATTRLGHHATAGAPSPTRERRRMADPVMLCC
jgi:hypothetical protein